MSTIIFNDSNLPKVLVSSLSGYVGTGWDREADGLFLIMFLKPFNLSFIPPPNRDSGEERIGGKVDLFRMVLWSNTYLCCLEIGSSSHRSAAV